MQWLAANLEVVVAALTALLAAMGVFLWRERKSRSHVMVQRSQAHLSHAEAEAKELAARDQLDASARAWAEQLIERYDGEVEELRCEIRAARRECREERIALEEKHARERAEWEREKRLHAEQLAQLRARIAAQQREIAQLRVLLERCGFRVGTGPLDVSALALDACPAQEAENA
jgi:chromosome segregation ATPase